ncbi:MAG: hypothetical protein WC420_01820 [Candidatus Paceibacterota bacterium]|jgi:hypothetical protein
MNKNLTIICSILVLTILATSFQYVNVLKSEIVDAYSTIKPANGHSWSEMECTTGLCVTSDNKVGIGTDSPQQKLSVAGTVQSTSGGFLFPDGTVQTTKAGTFSAANCTQVTASSSCAGGTHCTASAICPTSTYIVGGGCYGVPSQANNVYMAASVPLSVITSGAQGWYCHEYVGSALTWGTWPITTYGICCP